MHDAERLHLPIIQCLGNDNSPMFIGPYNTGTVLHGHCGLLSTVLYWLHCGTQCGYCTLCCTALQSTVYGLTLYGMRVQYSAVCSIIWYRVTLYALWVLPYATETGTTQQHHTPPVNINIIQHPTFIFYSFMCCKDFHVL